ncbi:MAG: prepilin-type N-terminal cleavage/methylation domain-containing protein [Pseudomonadota bacterium]
MSGERGATLMETLVALGVASLLAAAVTQTTGFGLTVLDRAREASSDGVEALRARRELSAALARVELADGALTGDASTVSWRGAAPDPESGEWSTGLWRWRAGDGALSLCAAPDECGEERPFGPADATLAYAGSDGVWRDDWTGGPPPRLIRATHEGGEIVVAPRLWGAAP